MTWGAVAVAGATIVGGVMANNAANKATNAQERSAQMAIDQSNQNYQRTAGNLNPYIDAGSSALAGLQKLNSGNYSSFNASPDYQFSLNQGLQGLDRSAAARGSLYSGGQNADILKYAQGLASQNYGNYYSRLSDLSKLGSDAATNLGSIGTGNAAHIGDYLTNSGNAAASGALNSATINSSALSGLASAFGNYMGNRPPPVQTASSYGSGSVLAGGNYTGSGSASTNWPGMNSKWNG